MKGMHELPPILSRWKIALMIPLMESLEDAEIRVSYKPPGPIGNSGKGFDVILFIEV